MCCSVLHGVAVLQDKDVVTKVITAADYTVRACQKNVRVAVCCSVLQCVAVSCSMMQCVAVCCSVLQCVAVC